MDAVREGPAAQSVDALAWGEIRIAQLNAPIVVCALAIGGAIWRAESTSRGPTDPITGDPGRTANLTRGAICFAAAGKARMI